VTKDQAVYASHKISATFPGVEALPNSDEYGKHSVVALLHGSVRDQFTSIDDAYRVYPWKVARTGD
jgi:hypothetical protein